MNDQWIFRFAHNLEGSRSLEREVALLPRLAPTLNVPIPDIRYFGRRNDSGLSFVGYPRLPGVPLTSEALSAMQPAEQEQVASDLGHFLTGLHTFSLNGAKVSGVVRAEYPFSRTQEGIMQGSATDIYRRELARLLSYPVLDESDRRFCTALVEQLMDEPGEDASRLALVHGDLSREHILFDPERNRISGIIDFTDAIITSPLIDHVYLYNAYGEPFFSRLLAHYRPDLSFDLKSLIIGVRRLHRWYVTLRLLWALDHHYKPRIESGLRVLRAMQTSAGE